MENNNVIFTPSGIRGIFGKGLTEEYVKKVAIAFGLWLSDKRVIIGRDTRPSGMIIEKAIIDGLLSTNCKVINLRVCPTPVVIYKKIHMNVPAGVIISGSHNPPDWNALKLISNTTFLSKTELNEVSEIMRDVDLNDYEDIDPERYKSIKLVDAIPDYLQALYRKINTKKIKKKNKLKVVIDTGAGAGKTVTPQLLEELGCDVTVINNDLDENSNFPRGIEPIEKNLKDLIVTVWKGKYDIGFAHDCDADRLAIVGDDFKWYPEDVSLALITQYFLKETRKSNSKIIFVTNVASSLMFEEICAEFDAQVIRTQIGERYLAEKMDDLIKQEWSNLRETIIFGGEASSGGLMNPYFNNARDGIYAAAKLIEILVTTKKKVSKLISKLPKYYSLREKIDCANKDIERIISNLKEELIKEGEDVQQIGMDLRIGKKNEWFTLIHPSNTEPIIRVIAEAKRESLARVYCETTAELVRLVISKL